VQAGKSVQEDGPAQEGGPARVAAFELVPTVCHVDAGGTTAVYWLEDYTDELAAAHWLSSADDPLTVDALWRLFVEGAATAVGDGTGQPA
jgi:hypothetical protein